MNVSSVSVPSSAFMFSPPPAYSTPAAPLAPGVYTHVIDGMVQLSNGGGQQNFSAGQFGFTGSIVQPPVVVPTNPGIQFNPPPAFSTQMAQTTTIQKAVDAYTDNLPFSTKTSTSKEEKVVAPPVDKSTSKNVLTDKADG